MSVLQHNGPERMLETIREAGIDITPESLGVTWEDIKKTLDTFILDQPADIVVLATPNCFHHDHAVKAHTQGVHILVEKPMAVRVTEAEEMQALALDRGLCLMVGQM